MKGILLVVLLLVADISFAQAKFEVVDGLRYLVDTEAGTATLVAKAEGKYTGYINVPENVVVNGKEYSVVAFGENCFKDCEELNNVNIPSSVVSLGRQCFYECYNLNSVTLPSSIKEIGELCFESCRSLTSVIVPSSVVSLGRQCFQDCRNLVNITLPMSVTSLGDRCFASCYSLNNITIPNSVTSIGDECFYGCSSLTRVDLPSSISTLGDRCFMMCSSLKSIIIPSSVISLGQLCFGDCSNLVNIELSKSILSLGPSCFDMCTSLSTITIPSSIQLICRSCFGGCSNLETIYFSDKIPTISSDFAPTTSIIYAPSQYLQDYKDALGQNYSFIYAWNPSDSGDKGDNVKSCAAPSISFADGRLQLSSSTPGAEYHYTITDDDMASDKLSQDGNIELSAAYKVFAYATADGYKASDKATATLYWVKGNIEGGSSTDIHQAGMRGVVASTNDGIVRISGLVDGERVSFYTIDGKRLNVLPAVNGQVSCAVSEKMVIVKIGNEALKIAVK